MRSKPNTPGFLALLSLTLLAGVLMVFALLTAGLRLLPDPTSIPTPTLTTSMLLLILSAGVFLLLASQLWRDANIITIERTTKTITFRNLFTRKERVYRFDYFDGFAEMYQDAESGSYRVVYLVKNRIYREKISGFYYSNLDELQAALRPVKYLGLKPFTFAKSLLILLKKPIPD